MLTTKYVEHLMKTDPKRAELIARKMWDGAMRAERFQWNRYNVMYPVNELGKQCETDVMHWAQCWMKANRALKQLRKSTTERLYVHWASHGYRPVQPLKGW